MLSLLPPPKAVYSDLEAAFTAIQLYAKNNGYTFKKHNKKPFRVVYSCNRAGKLDVRGKDLAIYKSKQRKATGTKKCRCLIRVELRQDSLSGNWILQVLEGVYNHVASIDITAYLVYRNNALTTEIRTQIGILLQSGLNPSEILTILWTAIPEIPLIIKDISNAIQEARLTELSGRTLIQWLLDVRYLYYFDYFTNLYTL